MHDLLKYWHKFTPKTRVYAVHRMYYVFCSNLDLLMSCAIFLGKNTVMKNDSQEREKCLASLAKFIT